MINNLTCWGVHSCGANSVSAVSLETNDGPQTLAPAALFACNNQKKFLNLLLLAAHLVLGRLHVRGGAYRCRPEGCRRDLPQPFPHTQRFQAGSFDCAPALLRRTPGCRRTSGPRHPSPLQETDSKAWGYSCAFQWCNFSAQKCVQKKNSSV